MRRLLVALSIGSVLTACAGLSLHRYPHDTTHVVSPLQIGSVEGNSVSVDASPLEAQYGVAEGTLRDDATLTALDANQICVQVTVRRLSEMEGAQTPLGSYRVFLRANQNVRDDAQVQGATQTLASVAGTRPRDVMTGSQNVCTGGYDRYGNCFAWSSVPTYSTVYDPAVYEVITQTGTACFANRGYVTLDTDEMEIYFVMPDQTDGVGFQWQFDVEDAPTT